MRLKISHTTQYTYNEPIPYALQQVRMTPKPGLSQSIIDWQTDIEGGQIEAQFTDQHNNSVMLVSFSMGTKQITLINQGHIETTTTAGVSGPQSGHMPLWLYKRATAMTSPGEAIKKLAKKTGKHPLSALDQLHLLSKNIGQQVRYETGKTNSTTSAEEALAAGHGVCQDHTHIFLSAARHLGFPARYVSGYLMMNDRVEQDAAHAWAEAYISDLGWVGFDVSNGISPDERYVHIATGLDYHEAAPISGVTSGTSGESLSVMLKVQQQ